MIKYILFHVMGVVFTVGDDTNELLIPYILERKNVSADQIRELYLAASLGEISACEFWLEAGFAPGEIECVQKEYLQTCLTLDDGFIACAEALKPKYTLALLSNDVAEWNAYLRKLHGIDEYIDFAFISSDLGVRKPDSRIYEVAIKAMGASPSECVFIDDDPERIAVASALGMMGILFNREEHEYEGSQVRTFEEVITLCTL